jgi:NDP-sugar pyrophosphorylase family protein
MNAIILAAGIGRRLRPITDEIPKALLPVIDRPIIDIVIDRLRKTGVEKIGINLFHHARIIADHLAGTAGIQVAIEKQLTDTGGPLLRFPRLLDEGFIFHNCDIVADLNLPAVLRYHRRQRALATLVLTKNPGTDLVETYRGRVIDFHGKEKKEFHTYAGIAVFSGAIRPYLPRHKRTFSIKEILRNAIRDRQLVLGFTINGYWRDIGSPRSYWQIHRDLMEGRAKVPGIRTIPSGRYVAPSSRVESENIAGFCCIGGDCQIERNVYLQDTVILPGTRMRHGNYQSAIISNKYCIPIK